MNVLDENVTRDQADLLRQWGIRFRSISLDFHRQGIHDDNVIPFLLRLKRPTLLTRDADFFEHSLVHSRYWRGLMSTQAKQHSSFGAFFCILHSEPVRNAWGK